MAVRVYALDLYHDEPDEASADVSGGGTWPTLSKAKAAARASMSDYWTQAGIRLGDLEPAVFGLRPEHFTVDDDELPWLMTHDDPTYCERG